MTDDNTTREWTSEEVESFLSALSEASFKTRSAVVVYLSLISIVGFLGNTVVLLVYGLRFKPCATRVFVLFMACLDLVTNTLGLPLQIATVRYAYNDNYWRCRSFFAFATLSTQASGLMLVLVALDRFWRICLPLKKQLNSRQAFKVSLGSTCCAVVIYACFVPFYGIHHIDTTQPGVRARMCWSEDEYKHTFYPKLYKGVVGITFFVGLFIILVSYLCIGAKLWRKKIQKKRSLRLQNQNPPTVDTSDLATDDQTDDDQDKHPGEGKTRLAQLQARARESCLSETSVSDSVSTEGCMANLNMQLPEPSVARISVLKDPEPGVTTQQRNSANCAAMTGEPCRPQTGDLPPGVRSSTLNPGQKQDVARKPRTPMTTGGTVHKGIRRMRSRTTLMMCVLSMFYVFNWLPHFAMRAIRSDPVNWCERFTECGYNVYPIVIRSYYINSAVNAFVYSFCSQRFRQKCRELFSACARRVRVVGIAGGEG